MSLNLNINSFFAVLLCFMLTSCQEKPDLVCLLTLNPGHFHAALVQKTMIAGIDSTVYVYAPTGKDLEWHLGRIEGYNTRAENPTEWKTEVYSGADFLDRMLQERNGNVVVLAGNNRNKSNYIARSIESGLDVLADKPMVIEPEQLEVLRSSFALAEKNGQLLYDIMTERYEITTILQRELSMIPEIFGEWQKGSQEAPAVVKESVHHFYKNVSGAPLVRPAWFMDVRQQGEGLVDVTTHLVDLVQWTCFPEQVLQFDRDVHLLDAAHWATELTRSQFSAVTQLSDFPSDFESLKVNDSTIAVYCNGSIDYTLRGIHARVKVDWAYAAGEGRGDTHYSHLMGTRARLVIRQGAEQNFKPVLYIEPVAGSDLKLMESAFTRIQKKYPGVALKSMESGWEVVIPKEYHNGHEAHFAQVLETFLKYRADGKLPEWERAGMLTKYELLMMSLELVRPK